MDINELKTMLAEVPDKAIALKEQGFACVATGCVMFATELVQQGNFDQFQKLVDEIDEILSEVG